jgi:hypothetical protein
LRSLAASEPDAGSRFQVTPLTWLLTPLNVVEEANVMFSFVAYRRPEKSFEKLVIQRFDECQKPA